MPFHILERLFFHFPLLFLYLDNVWEMLRQMLRQMNTVLTFVENIVKKIAKE